MRCKNNKNLNDFGGSNELNAPSLVYKIQIKIQMQNNMQKLSESISTDIMN
jgi:hypothetical protein